MKKLELLPVGLLASFLLSTTGSVHAASLSDDQLDNITAAGVTATVQGYGLATGKTTSVYVDADTRAEASELGAYATGLGIVFALGTGNEATAAANTEIKVNGSGQLYQNYYSVDYSAGYGRYGVAAAVSAGVGAGTQ